MSVRIFAILALASACSMGPDAAREPPQFNVLPKGQVHSAMWQLAGFSAELDRLLRNPSDAIDRAKVVRMLAGMEIAAGRLTEDSLREQHPLLDANADELLRDVRSARAAAEADTPNYYLAGVVSGSCIYCHHPEGGLQSR